MKVEIALIVLIVILYELEGVAVGKLTLLFTEYSVSYIIYLQINIKRVRLVLI